VCGAQLLAKIPFELHIKTLFQNISLAARR